MSQPDLFTLAAQQQPLLHPDHHLGDDVHGLAMIGVDGDGAPGAPKNGRGWGRETLWKISSAVFIKAVLSPKE